MRCCVKRQSGSKTASWNFALIELLIIIAVIAIIIGFLIPLLNKAKGKATGVTCLSNLKQIGSAQNVYAADSDGFIPILSYTSSTIVHYAGGETIGAGLSKGHMPLLTENGYLPGAMSKDNYKEIANAKRAVNLCPAIIQQGTLPDLWSYRQGGSYGMNAVLNRTLWLNSGLRMRRLETLIRPSERFMMADTNTYERQIGQISNLEWLHNEEGGFLYSDGHGGFLKFYNFPQGSSVWDWGNNIKTPYGQDTLEPKPW